MKNSSFSEIQPNLQLAWDSTSLGALKECPMKYYYSIVEGYVPRAQSVHLTFGLHYHGALERYDHAKAQGLDHEAATAAAVRYALEVTWNYQLNRPWISDDRNKNRFTLVRTVVWYLEEFKDDPLETVILASGKPAVELSFRFETSYSSFENEKFWLCGHLDRVATLNGDAYIADRKTTGHTINQDFFAKFTPDNQFSTYSLGGKIAYSLPLHGLIVDGVQIAVNFSRFERGIVERKQDTLEEWYKDLGMWLEQAETYARRGHWPHNDKACHHFNGCPYREVCKHSPSVRNEWLERLYVRRIWDPLQIRGDI